MAVTVWGGADPREAVTVKIGEVHATAWPIKRGKWSVKLPGMKADPRPRQLIITGKTR